MLFLSLIFCKQEDYWFSGAFQVAPAYYIRIFKALFYTKSEILSVSGVTCDTVLATSLMADIVDHVTCRLKHDLDTLNERSKQWIVTPKASKQNCSSLSKISGRQLYPSLYLNKSDVNEATVHKHIGLVFNNKMSWTDHINDICKKCSKRLDIIQKMKCILPRSSVEKQYKSFICSIILTLSMTIAISLTLAN